MFVSANTGAARGRVDNLLFFHEQTAPEHNQVPIPVDSYQHNDHTFVYSFYASQSLLNTQSKPRAILIPSPISNSTKDALESTSIIIIDQETGTSPTIQHSLEQNQAHDVLYKTQELHIRTLTHSFRTKASTMTDVVTVPGSPPDLAGSRSSKSSSYGSQFSATDEASTEITNFEEIGLEDDVKQSHDKIPGPSANAPSAPTGQHQAPYYTVRRTTASSMSSTRGSAQDATKSVASSPLDMGFNNQSASAFSRQDTGASSSQPRLPRSTSTTALDHSSLGVSSGRYPFVPRRGSWQPRKTVKEIEAEFHDSDDDLPEDASLWNVPVSPFISNDHSARSSARGSPNRAHILSPQPLPLEHFRSAPDSPPNYKGPATQSLPRQRTLTRSVTSNDTSSSYPSSPKSRGNLRDHRTKSWNMAMTELSVEARILSQNLEYHAEQNGRSSSQGTKSGKWSPPNPHRSSAPSTIQLPPVQRGTLDFMPISKEKEAILSRTRPSWLPPKDPKEEKKHLKEYQRMMAASIEAERKRETYQKNRPCEEDDTQTRIDRVWNYYIEPTTDIMTIDRRVHDLCWRGISPRVRGKVWQRTIGNPLGLTKNTYGKALQRAKDVKSKLPQDRNKHELGLIASFSDIERDAETAFPELNVFQRNGPLWQDLIDICEAHACYRGDIGHLYGIQLIGALMLLQVPDVADAFVLLENCLNSPVPLAFQTGDVNLTQRTYSRVMSTLGIKFPRLHEYLFETPEEGGLGLTGQAVFEPMFRTMFSNGLDIDRLCRVWDIWVFEGDRALVKTAVALLGSLQSQIFDVAGDIDLKRRNVQEMLGWGPFNRTDRGAYWKLNSIGGEDAFVEEIRTAGKLDYTGR